MRRCALVIILILAFQPCYGQWGSSPAVSAGHDCGPWCRARQQSGPGPLQLNEVGSGAVESACIVKGRLAGSGILICKGADFGIVWTCAHGTGEKERLEVQFPSKGQTISGRLLAADGDSDTALVYLEERPLARAAKIAETLPVPGARIIYAGFGRGRWAKFEGRFIRQAANVRLKDHPTLQGVMVWSGGARQGDSGGPVWDYSTGDVYGIITGTDGSETVGPGVDKLYQLLQGRYVFPWNANLAAKNVQGRYVFPWNANLAARNGQQQCCPQQAPGASPFIQPNPPAPLPPPPPCDLTEIRAELAALRQLIEEIKATPGPQGPQGPPGPRGPPGNDGQDAVVDEDNRRTQGSFRVKVEPKR